jgi:hypothetical protein
MRSKTKDPFYFTGIEISATPDRDAEPFSTRTSMLSIFGLSVLLWLIIAAIVWGFV